MKRRSLLLSVLSLPGLAVAQEQKIAFAEGKVEVALPGNLRVVSNEKQTLVATFGPEADHKLEFTLHEELLPAKAADAAEQFVREQSQKKGRRLHEAPGKVLFMEAGGEFMQDGKAYRVLHFQVGFGKLFVVVTLTGPHPASPDMKQFLGGPINAVVSSLRRRES